MRLIPRSVMRARRSSRRAISPCSWTARRSRCRIKAAAKTLSPSRRPASCSAAPSSERNSSSSSRQKLNARMRRKNIVSPCRRLSSAASSARARPACSRCRRQSAPMIPSPLFRPQKTAMRSSVCSPSPHTPQGIYGANTFTQNLPASGRGQVVSGKLDDYFRLGARQQSFTARYNFTQDSRIIPVTGDALFSSLKPRVRTQNLSLFLNSELSQPDSSSPLFNQVRLSYGRTRLVFNEVRDTQFLRRSSLFPNEPFLLNAPYVVNVTLPDAPGVPNTGPVDYISTGFNVEDILGAVGQVKIAGFSPVGVDVFNFPQRRVNNTYQIADNLTWRRGNHSFAFGADIRRTELNSDAAPNARPLVTFNGAPEVAFGQDGVTLTGRFFRAVDLAAAGAASGFMQTLATTNSDVQLRFKQLNFYGQDTWRIRPRLSLSLGLRYEYNTVPRDSQQRIEKALTNSDINNAPDLMAFTAGRKRIFDPDKTNFGPRIGIAYSPDWFGHDHPTVVRGGYGLFYDPPLGAVVSQSRNVFPAFFTVNFAGGTGGVGNSLGG